MRILLLTLAILGGLSQMRGRLCGAQSLKCDEVTAISKMAEAKSNQSLATWRMKAGDSYAARLVYSFRLFELTPSVPAAASKLLAMIPPDKEQEPIWHSLNGFLCEKEQVNEIKTLARFQVRMPRDVARAVLIVPEKLADYVSYAYDSVQDPHSDYAIQMRSACRARHGAFVKAVDSLASHDKQWFIAKIFDPNECRAIAVPEAD